jgi:choline dehydrogenase-like flavoprotein
MDLRSPNRFAQVFVDAGAQAGFPVNRDFNGADLEGVGIYQVTHKNGERFSAAKAYVTPNLSRPNLKVITDAHTTRVLLEGQRATGVEYAQGGTLHQLTAAREVILSAGALMSPQLLMLSGIGPAGQLRQHGIAVALDLPGVGMNLHDHIDVVLVVDAPHLKDLFGLSLTGLVRTVKGIFEWRDLRSGMLTTNFAEAGGFIKSSDQETIPDLQLHFVIGKLADHGRKTMFGHGYSCHVCLLQPKSRGSVRLGGPDPMAPPLIDPNFLGEADDLQRLVRGFKLMRKLLAQPALAGYGGRELATSAKAQSDEEIVQFIRSHADTIYHPGGTCRMGPGEMDVVDARLRVRGIAGLRVVDASVMPRIVSGNTNAPVIMIAEKAADMIRQDARRGADAVHSDIATAVQAVSV